MMSAASPRSSCREVIRASRRLRSDACATTAASIEPLRSAACSATRSPAVPNWLSPCAVRASVSRWLFRNARYVVAVTPSRLGSSLRAPARQRKLRWLSSASATACSVDVSRRPMENPLYARPEASTSSNDSGRISPSLPSMAGSVSPSQRFSPGSMFSKAMVWPGRYGIGARCPDTSTIAPRSRSSTASGPAKRMFSVRVRSAMLWMIAQFDMDAFALCDGVDVSPMLRWALLLSLITFRSVDGHPGVFPTSDGGMMSSTPGTLISAARQRCVDEVMSRCHGTIGATIGPASAGLNGTLTSALLRSMPVPRNVMLSTYGLPVPNFDTRKCTLTLAGPVPVPRRDTRTNAQLSPFELAPLPASSWSG